MFANIIYVYGLIVYGFVQKKCTHAYGVLAHVFYKQKN